MEGEKEAEIESAALEDVVETDDIYVPELNPEEALLNSIVYHAYRIGELAYYAFGRYA
jgi:hypothetical protein